MANSVEPNADCSCWAFSAPGRAGNADTLENGTILGRGSMQPRNLERGTGRALTSLVFPAYNPGPLIERTWWEVKEFLRRAPGTWEVLFVCDGCTDGTPERLAELTSAEADRVRVL